METAKYYRTDLVFFSYAIPIAKSNAIACAYTIRK